MVWNSNEKFERVAVLKGHENFVKGVTWDPVGSYLASQSTDNTVRVWNTVDWKEETKIEGPDFEIKFLLEFTKSQKSHKKVPF